MNPTMTATLERCKVLSQRDLFKWQLPKGIFLSVNFPNLQFPKFVLAATLGPQPVLAMPLNPLACALSQLQPVVPKRA